MSIIDSIVYGMRTLPEAKIGLVRRMVKRGGGFMRVTRTERIMRSASISQFFGFGEGSLGFGGLSDGFEDDAVGIPSISKVVIQPEGFVKDFIASS